MNFTAFVLVLGHTLGTWTTRSSSVFSTELGLGRSEQLANICSMYEYVIFLFCWRKRDLRRNIGTHIHIIKIVYALRQKIPYKKVESPMECTIRRYIRSNPLSVRTKTRTHDDCASKTLLIITTGFVMQRNNNNILFEIKLKHSFSVIFFILHPHTWPEKVFHPCSVSCSCHIKQGYGKQ